jgi:hypothetical protein
VDESHPSHVCGQLIDLVKVQVERGVAVGLLPQIEDEELVGRVGANSGIDINRSDPIAFCRLTR